MKLKKISSTSVFKYLSEKEMKSIEGGYNGSAICHVTCTDNSTYWMPYGICDEMGYYLCGRCNYTCSDGCL